MRKRQILSYSMMLVALALGNVWARPAWMDRHPQFPSDLYFVGVGEGDTREKAESGALANLAKVFYAEIHQDTDQEETYQTDSKSEIHQHTMNVHTQVSTDKILEGAEIIETAQEGSVYYALAVLDRLKTATRLTKKIQELDRDLRAMQEAAKNAPDKLTRIKHFKKAMDASALREAYNTDLAIVSVTGQDIPEPIPSIVLEQSLTALLSDLLVYVQVTGPHEEILQNLVMDAIEQEGIPSTPYLEATPEEDAETFDLPMGDLIVKGNLMLTPVTLTGQPFKYIRWCVSLALHERTNNKVVGVIGLSGREGHQSLEEAKARALRELQPKVTEEVRAHLSDYLSGVSRPTANSAPSCVQDPS